MHDSGDDFSHLTVKIGGARASHTRLPAQATTHEIDQFTAEFERQACFLFTVISRKTDMHASPHLAQLVGGRDVWLFASHSCPDNLTLLAGKHTRTHCYFLPGAPGGLQWVLQPNCRQAGAETTTANAESAATASAAAAALAAAAFRFATRTLIHE